MINPEYKLAALYWAGYFAVIALVVASCYFGGSL